MTCSPESLLRSGGAWRRADQLSIGDPLYRSLREGLFGTSTNLYLHYTTEHPASGPSEVALPSKWSVELAEFLGYALAHGPGGRDELGRLCAIFLYADLDDEDLVAYLAKVVRGVFNKEATVNRRAIHHVSVHSLDIGGMIDQLGMGGAMDDRAMPPAVLSAPRPILQGFLRGYIERKCHFGRYHGPGSLPMVTIGCAGKNVAEQLASALALFGVNTFLRRNPPTGITPSGMTRRPTYHLLVTPAESKRRLIQRIGFISERKKALGQTLLAEAARFAATKLADEDSLTIADGCDLRALKEETMRRRRHPSVPDGLRGRFEELASYASLLITTGKSRIPVLRAQCIVNELPADIVDATAPFLREAVEGDYHEVQVDAISRGVTDHAVGLAAAPHASYLVDGMVVAGSRQR